MEIQATISETREGKPTIKIDDDGTLVTFHLLTEDSNELKRLWRENAVFLITSEKKNEPRKNHRWNCDKTKKS